MFLRLLPRPVSFLSGVATRPANVHEALISLQTVSERMRAADDLRGVFPDVYGVITRRVVEALEDGLFWEPAWIEKLAGRFAELYFDALIPALDDRPCDTMAWQLALKPHALRMPVRDAILGINAHINVDLARGIADNIRAAGGANDPVQMARYRHDHDAVNGVLRSALPEVYARLSDAWRCPLTRPMTSGPVRAQAVGAAAMLVVEDWRDRVWGDAVALLHASPARQAALLQQFDARAVRFARVWSGPLGVETPPAFAMAA